MRARARASWRSMALDLAAIRAAHERIRPHIHRTYGEAVRVSFLPAERRAELERAFRAEMQRLKPIHLDGDA